MFLNQLMDDLMMNSVCEIVIRVRDLDGCRIFYRDVLQLGDPVSDSGFNSTFALNDGLMLTLEKSAAPFLEHASGATLWRFAVADFRKFRDHLADCGCELTEDPCGGSWRGGNGTERRIEKRICVGRKLS